jgi:DeoR/GlpR family transcriptional regulator of sugar metabolism
VVLATAEKLKESAAHLVASLSDIDTLIVEPGRRPRGGRLSARSRR